MSFFRTALLTSCFASTWLVAKLGGDLVRQEWSWLGRRDEHVLHLRHQLWRHEITLESVQKGQTAKQG